MDLRVNTTDIPFDEYWVALFYIELEDSRLSSRRVPTSENDSTISLSPRQLFQVLIHYKLDYRGSNFG